MKIYVNGCSFTRGSHTAMENRLDLAYPNLLKNHYNAELINYSKGGNSNDCIFRVTIEYLTQSPIPVDKVIIQWSKPDRFETGIINHKPKSYIRQYPKGEYIKFFSDHFTNYSNIFYQKLLTQMYALECVFKEQAISDYRFIVWTPAQFDESFGPYKWLDKSKIIFNAYDLLYEEGFRYHELDRHFGIAAHARIAEWIINDFSSGLYFNFKHSEMPESHYT